MNSKLNNVRTVIGFPWKKQLSYFSGRYFFNSDFTDQIEDY